MKQLKLTDERKRLDNELKLLRQETKLLKKHPDSAQKSFFNRLVYWRSISRR